MNQLVNIKTKFTSQKSTTTPIKESVYPSIIYQETSASISTYNDILITKSGQHHTSLTTNNTALPRIHHLANINNKDKKEKVIEKSFKEIDQTNQYVGNITDQRAKASSSLTTL